MQWRHETFRLADRAVGHLEKELTGKRDRGRLRRFYQEDPS